MQFVALENFFLLRTYLSFLFPLSTTTATSLETAGALALLYVLAHSTVIKGVKSTNQIVRTGKC
jgi:hypothetical protein